MLLKNSFILDTERDCEALGQIPFLSLESRALARSFVAGGEARLKAGEFSLQGVAGEGPPQQLNFLDYVVHILVFAWGKMKVSVGVGIRIHAHGTIVSCWLLTPLELAEICTQHRKGHCPGWTWGPFTTDGKESPNWDALFLFNLVILTVAHMKTVPEPF